MKPQVKSIQYTLRNVPESADRLLREKASTYGMSLNETALKALQTGLGQSSVALHHDLDVYAGSWIQDNVFDDVMKDRDRIDDELWA
jgi:hypothetical protein